MKLLKLFLFLGFGVAGYSQGTPYDCSSVFSFTAVSAQTGQDNSSSIAPCIAWRVTYTTSGFSSATVKFQTSADNASWSDITNSICSSSVQPPCVTDGANPLAAGKMGSSSFRAYGKYVRVNVTSVSGSGSGQVVVYGYKGTSASAALGNGSSPSGGGNSACPTASSLGFLLNGSDETTLLNSTIAGGTVNCLAIDSAKTLRADGQIVMPTSGSPTSCAGTSFRITGAMQGGWAAGPSVLDLRYHGSGITAYQGGPKIISLGFSTLQIDNVTIADGGSDCALYVFHSMAKLVVDHATFAGDVFPYTSACHDAIVTGGTNEPNATITCTIADWAGGQAVITHSNFSGMARAWWARSSANGEVFDGNWIQGKNPASPFAAIDIDGFGSGASANRGLVIANNLVEQLNGDYACGIHLNNAGSVSMSGNQFWDGGTVSYCLGSNLFNMSVLSNYSENSQFSGSWGTGSNLIGLGLSNPTANQTYKTVSASFDGGGSVVTGPTTRCANVPLAGTITEFSAVGDQSGSATVTVKSVATSAYTDPSSASDISNGGEGLSSVAKKIDSTLTGWTTAFSADTTVCFVLTSPSTFTWLNTSIKIAAN